MQLGRLRVEAASAIVSTFEVGLLVRPAGWCASLEGRVKCRAGGGDRLPLRGISETKVRAAAAQCWIKFARSADRALTGPRGLSGQPRPHAGGERLQLDTSKNLAVSARM